MALIVYSHKQFLIFTAGASGPSTGWMVMRSSMATRTARPKPISNRTTTPEKAFVCTTETVTGAILLLQQVVPGLHSTLLFGM